MICKYRNHFDIKIICYLREIVSYYTSFYCYASTWLSSQDSSPSFCNFIEYIDRQKGYVSTYNLLTKLTKILPDDNIIVRPYDKRHFREQKIDNDFFDILNVDTKFFQFIVHKNISPSLQQAEEIYYALSLTQNRYVKQRAKEQILNSKGTIQSMITKNELDAIYERYRDYEIKLQRLFFSGIKEKNFWRNPTAIG